MVTFKVYIRIKGRLTTIFVEAINPIQAKFKAYSRYPGAGVVDIRKVANSCFSVS